IHYFEDWCAVIDALEPCKNIMQNMMLLRFPQAGYTYTVTTGIKMSPRNVQMAGERIINIERMFGIREGITRKDDMLPKRFLDTPLADGASAGSVLDMDLMLDEYYQSRCWDMTTGHPTEETLEKLGLDYAIPDLQ
ncbi:MAG: aldehyde ferredoxin oxidoreductase C-terminal domain-containing protein, partial [Candidatus Bathyarchaeota archaeon]